LIEKLRSNKSEAKLMMLSEEVNMKFKAEFRMPEISQTENLLKEHKFNKCSNKPLFKDLMSVPHMFPRAKIEITLHLENPTTSKIEKLSDQMIMICKTAEVEAIMIETIDKKSDRRLDKNTEKKKTDQEEEVNKKNNSKNNFLSPKGLDKKLEEIITRRTLAITTTEELMINMKDKNKEIVLHLSGMTDKEVNLEAKRVLNLHLELQIYFDV
jgi:hypothetical protein